MPNRSTRDEMQGVNSDGTKQVAPPTRSAFDPAPTTAKAAPVQSTPQPSSTPAATPVDNPTSDLSALNAVKNLQQRKGKINQAIDDAS
jgi:hypothetical protein